MLPASARSTQEHTTKWNVKTNQKQLMSVISSTNSTGMVESAALLSPNSRPWCKLCSLISLALAIFGYQVWRRPIVSSVRLSFPVISRKTQADLTIDLIKPRLTAHMPCHRHGPEQNSMSNPVPYMAWLTKLMLIGWFGQTTTYRIINVVWDHIKLQIYWPNQDVSPKWLGTTVKPVQHWT